MTQPQQPEQPWDGQNPQPGQPYGQQPYGGPQYNAPQPGAPLSPQDEKTWAILSHVGGILFSFVAPLIIWLVYRGRGPYLEDQSKEALNFSLTVLIGYIAASILAIVSFGLLSFLPVLVGVAALILGIIAAVAASKYTWYRYPVCIRFIK